MAEPSEVAGWNHARFLYGSMSVGGERRLGCLWGKRSCRTSSSITHR
jgi:hypothetical protein